MFICTLKASNIKFFAAVLAAVTVLISIIVFSSDVTAQTTDAIAAANEKISFEKVKTNERQSEFSEAVRMGCQRDTEGRGHNEGSRRN